MVWKTVFVVYKAKQDNYEKNFSVKLVFKEK